MNLPKIDLSALPDLDSLTGVFGSLSSLGQAAASDDTILVLMTFLYELLPPEVDPNGLFF
ncbi:MAG: hypothetical protein ACREBO_11175 [Novosphingobium sp.]